MGGNVKRLIVVIVAMMSLASAGSAGAATHLREFQAPSGNIGCVVSNKFGTEARCDIANHSWKATRKPKSCHLDWGNGIILGAKGRARFSCAGDTTLHQGPKIRYGRSVHLQPFTCKVTRAGVTCKNAHKHGFFISKQSYRLF